MNDTLSFFVGIVGSALFAVSGAVAQVSDFSTGSTPEPSTERPVESQTTSPRRLQIAVSVTEPEDLKVAEGDFVEVGQILADRDRERQRLELQRDELQLSLDRLEAAIITPPLPPAPVPEMAQLPKANYQEQQARIDRALANVETTEFAVADNCNGSISVLGRNSAYPLDRSKS
ncbi:MAG: hypothetical protein J7641_18330 [Cyanobacteria bacterium SID2]|nr:hypothetical protein [Cyanobacteria bacterium SID2]MBP0005419.1 hypothetical protein [Cyanobacteria bacterium SBC]